VTVSNRDHLLALRACDRELHQERDRRYAEVNVEREKALKIKEEADKVALDLARQIQDYKDTKANELREQISSERGLYATHDELRALEDKLTAMLSPVIAYVQAQTGRSKGLQDYVGFLVAAAALVTSILYVAVR